MELTKKHYAGIAALVLLVIAVILIGLGSRKTDDEKQKETNANMKKAGYVFLALGLVAGGVGGFFMYKEKKAAASTDIGAEEFCGGGSGTYSSLPSDIFKE